MEPTKCLFSKTFLLIFLAVSIFGEASAQKKQGTISGSVVDSAKGKPLAFATVGLYRVRDQQKPVKNLFADGKGRFQFSQVDTGHYIIFVSNAGFQENQSSNITISEPGQLVELPPILLSPASKNLATVTVSARVPLIEQSDDKLTYNAESDPSVLGQNAIDVLRKTPFLSVDGDGNVQLNGQSNFKVLLDGKETAMFSKNLKDALQSFPANLIKKVEVITSPSSKYDGEGVAGIINIITKKKVKGFNGNVSVSRNTLRNTNSNANLNFKYGKIGFTAHYGFNTNSGLKVRNASETESFNPVAFNKRVSTGKRVNSNFYNYGNAELSMDIDSLTTVSSYANLNGGVFRSEIERLYDVITPDKSDTLRSNFYEKGKFNYPTINWGVDFIRKFKRIQEQELSFKMYHEYNHDDNLIEGDQQHASSMRSIINDNKANNRQGTWQVDYVHPFKNKTRLEGGLKAILRRASANYESLLKYSQSEKYRVDSLNSDNFKYDQNVYSAYVTYRFSIKKFNFRLGTRLEQTTVDGDFIKSNTKVRQDYLTFMPSFFVSRKYSNIHTLSLSYNKRLARPYIWDLNPFINNIDSLNLYFGNPGLDAELYHAFELAYTVFKGKTNINIRLTESFSNTQITRFSYFDDVTGVTSWTSDNIGSYSSTGLSGNLSLSITNSWRVNTNVGLRYDFVKNTRNAAQKNQGLGGFANINSNYDINKKFAVSIIGNLWKSPVQLQGRYGNNYFYGVGANYKFMKNKLTVSLNGNNFFQREIVWRSYFKDDNFQTQQWNYRPARAINLSLRWTFGKLTENVSRKRGVSNDDLKARD